MPQMDVHRWKQQGGLEVATKKAGSRQEAAEEGTEAESGSLSVARAQVFLFLFLSLPPYLSCNVN